MYIYKDLSRLTRTATIVVGSYLLLDLITSAGALAEGPPVADEARISDFFALLQLLVLIACVSVVGRWIYRASVNAHAITDEMTISPGWAVGWYFIPFANLFKPFQAMREIWHASHETFGGYEERTPQILGWWWGLWLVNGVIGNISARLSWSGVAPASTVDALNMASAALNIPLCLILITIMREVAQTQPDVFHASAFA